MRWQHNNFKHDLVPPVPYPQTLNTHTHARTHAHTHTFRSNFQSYFIVCVFFFFFFFLFLFFRLLFLGQGRNQSLFSLWIHVMFLFQLLFLPKDPPDEPVSKVKTQYITWIYAGFRDCLRRSYPALSTPQVVYQFSGTKSEMMMMMISVCVYVCVSVCMCVCVRACVRVCVCIYISFWLQAGYVVCSRQSTTISLSFSWNVCSQLWVVKTFCQSRPGLAVGN